MKSLDGTALSKVQVTPSKKVFTFGDSWKVYSKYKAIIPAKICKNECYIQTKIVNEKILLLLSKSSLKTVNTYINIKDDKAQMFDQDINKWTYSLWTLIPLNIVWYLRLMMKSIKNVENW